MEAPVNSRKSNGFVEQDGTNVGVLKLALMTGNTPAPSLKIPLVPKFPVVLISDRTRYIKSIVLISQCLSGRSKLTSPSAGLHFTEMRPF